MNEWWPLPEDPDEEQPEQDDGVDSMQAVHDEFAETPFGEVADQLLTSKKPASSELQRRVKRIVEVGKMEKEAQRMMTRSQKLASWFRSVFDRKK